MRKENLPVSSGKKHSAILWNTAGEIQEQYLLLCIMFDVVCVTGTPSSEVLNYEPVEAAFLKQADYLYVTDEEQVEQVMKAYGVSFKIVTLFSLWRFGNNRHAVKEQWIADKLGSLQGTLLDAGAGERPYMKYCGHLHYISQDFGKYDEVSETGAHWGPTQYKSSQSELVCDITDIPLPDNSLDGILCSEVFEHLPDPMPAVYEFRRLLKPGGRLFLTVPFFQPTHFAPYYFYAGFGEAWFEANLGKGGFAVEEILSLGNYYDVQCTELLRTLPSIRLYCKDTSEWSYMDAITDGLIAMLRLSRRSSDSQSLGNCGYVVEAVKL